MSQTSVNTRRRALLKASSLSAGLAFLPGRAAATRRSGGLRPMYRQSDQASASVSAQSPSAIPTADIRALRRLTFGLKPDANPANPSDKSSVDYFMALETTFDGRLDAWVNEQLDAYVPPAPNSPPYNDDPLLADAYNASNVTFETLDKDLATLWQTRVLTDLPWPQRQYPLIETQSLAFMRATYSQWQLAEVLADFWHTHFSVNGWEFTAAPVFVHYDRDVIRAHMLGNFRTMLEAVAKSTAMMHYLDNVSNTKWGPNENYARELQELHTLGAVNSYGFTPEGDIPDAASVAFAGSSAQLPAGLKAGYSEPDVINVTRALTGWTISNEWNDGNNLGTFLYWDDWHDTDSKRVLGVDIDNANPADPYANEQEVHQILDLLALHPNTARYVCGKLCRRLIGDAAPGSIVETAAAVFNDKWQDPDQLKQVVKTIVLSNEFKDAGTWGGKLKRPFETVAGAMRSCQLNFSLTNGYNGATADHDISRNLQWVMNDTGHMPFTWETPDGFPDYQQAWAGSTPLIMSWRALNWLFRDWDYDDASDTFRVDANAATKTALAANQRTPNNIVDYWLERILGYTPSGPQFDPAKRAKLVAFMQQDAAGPDTVLDLDEYDWDSQPWQSHIRQRVQTLVASILMLPEAMLR